MESVLFSVAALELSGWAEWRGHWRRHLQQCLHSSSSRRSGAASVYDNDVSSSSYE